MTDKIKVRVVRVDEHQAGDQGFTVGKIYDGWNIAQGMVNAVDDRGIESALFDGEWEFVDESQS